jgi:WD40 repeat protein
MSKLSASDILGFATSKLAPKTREKRLESAWKETIDDHVISLAVAPNGKQIAAAGVEGKIYLLDAATGAKNEIGAHGFGAKMVSFSRDGKFLTSAGQDGKIKLWNAENGALLKTLEGGAAWVETVKWSPRSDIFVSTAGKKIRLWNASGDLIHEYPEQNSTVADAAWSPASEKFVTACYGGLTEWRAADTIPVHKYGWKGSTLVIAWSPNGKYIATGDQDSTVHFWITRTGKDLQMYGYPTKVKELAWDATGRFLATGGGGFVTVWNCEPSPEGTTPMQLKGHENYLSCLAFQPAGLLLASGDLDGKISLWHVGQNGRFQSAARLGGEIACLNWLPDNRNIAVGAADGTVALISVG